ncbi:MAG: hypothetical protein CMM58_12745 [Rhodospirillaceae bacterium]|nr:hypothetical protein [Rhodospirillaceae bacterium]|tara:strand:+ start:1952 stop:2287 length:336 start_codon:yes stop_codon:yes gene_type:complete
MPIRLEKPWIDFSSANLGGIACHLGVYQLGTEEEIVYIGVADARSRFGLKGELESWSNDFSLKFDRFRIEINMAYRTRHLELLQVFYSDYGRLPVGNLDVDVSSLGQLRPG